MSEGFAPGPTVKAIAIYQEDSWDTVEKKGHHQSTLSSLVSK